MATQTTNLGLTLPDNGEKVSRQIINTNNTLIDNAFSGVGAKIYDVTLEVSNVSGAYSGTVYDDKITASMRAIDIYAVDPSIFNDKIHVTCQAGYLTITCDDVAGTTDVTISVLKSANDPTALTSTEFDILSNRIGDLDDLTTTVKTNVVNAINEVNSGLSTANDHISTLDSTVTNLITTTTKSFTCGNSQVDGFYYANIQLTSGEMSKCISATIIESDSNHYAALQLIENSAIVRVWGKVSGQQGQVRLVFKN